VLRGWLEQERIIDPGGWRGADGAAVELRD
jgi:hypothetical protein